jgi:hypothetical protein
MISVPSSVQVKVQLSLWITKYHATKTYGEVEMVSFTPRPLCSQGKIPRYHWVVGWVGPRAGLDAVTKRKILASAGNRTLDVQLVD